MASACSWLVSGYLISGWREVRCCYKCVRGLLMAGHAQTNCFLLFTYNQSLPQAGTTGEEQGGGKT